MITKLEAAKLKKLIRAEQAAQDLRERFAHGYTNMSADEVDLASKAAKNNLNHFITSITEK